MPIKQIMLLLVVFLGGCITAMADVPADPGFKRISLNLIVETQSDFPEYRFFIKSGADLEEITLKKGEPFVIEPLGGGAFYRTGTLVAVSKKSLEGLSETPAEGKLNDLQRVIYDGNVPGTLELVKHSFAREVPILEAPGWKDPVYRIEADPQAGLKAVHLSGGSTNSKIDDAASSGLAFWRSASAAVVAGIFLAFGLLIIGVWYFRKSSKAV